MFQLRCPFKWLSWGEKWTECFHMFSKLCVIPDLIDETKPTSYVSCAGGCWEVLNGVVVLREWFYSFIRYVESSKVCGSACKLEFEGIQYDASFPNSGDEFDCSPPVYFQIGIIKQGVVSDSFFAQEISQNCFKATIVPVSGGQKTLRGSCVTITPKWCNKGCEMTVCFS